MSALQMDAMHLNQSTEIVTARGVNVWGAWGAAAWVEGRRLPLLGPDPSDGS